MLRGKYLSLFVVFVVSGALVFGSILVTLASIRLHPSFEIITWSYWVFTFSSLVFAASFVGLNAD